MSGTVVGRFAPSPSGPLHAGSLVAALGSWLDARARGGRWHVRLEDLDTPRNVPGADRVILDQLTRLGLDADGPVLRQSTRLAAYDAALRQLERQGDTYPCACSRRELALAARTREGRRADPDTDADEAAERVYPGTCRNGTHGRAARSIRLRTAGAGRIEWFDRRLGAQSQALEREVGDVVLRRADGIVAYQLAVVVDDACQGVTDVVRGADLADNTARQVWLQRRLGLSTPRYLHLPLVRGADGRKLSKQNGAPPLDLRDDHAVLRTLAAAAATLGLAHPGAATRDAWLDAAIVAWRVAFPLPDDGAGAAPPALA